MTIQKSRPWLLEEAREVAEDLITLLRPACERIQVAGSIRRNKARVGDIELLAISKVGPAIIHLDARVAELLAKGILDYRLNKRGARTYGRLNKLLIHAPSGMPVDLFSTVDKYWGMALVVRTGSREFNIRVMTRFKALGLKGHAYAGVEDLAGPYYDCPTEEDVFRLLQWPYVPPEKRL